MTARIVLDPSFLGRRAEIETWSTFWLRLIGWAADKRVKVGICSAASPTIGDLYGLVHSDEADFPPHTRKDRMGLILPLLSRIADGDMFEVPDGADVDPLYLGQADTRQLLLGDLLSAMSVEGVAVALASEGALWQRPETSAVLSAGSDQYPFEIVDVPHADLSTESEERFRDCCRDSRLFVVGGQPEARVLTTLKSFFDEVRWLPCERNSKPDVKKKWSSLDPARDYAVVVTGRVGHATSNAAERAATGSGLECLHAYQTSNILETLRAHIRATLDE